MSTGKSQAKPSPAMPPVIGQIDEDLSSDEKEEGESFQTKQLFLFAWQIAKGMVITILLFSEQLINVASIQFLFTSFKVRLQTISRARNKG